MTTRKALFVLIAATAFTRWLFRSHWLYDLDSVNFALALDRFDPSSHQPHPPGYFLYVQLGRLANMVFQDANTALIAVSILFSCGAAAMFYLLAEEWFGRSAALFAGWIFLFSPLAWFHGTVALTYIAEAFFSALIGYLCWRIQEGATSFILPAAVALGIAAGFRPSSLFLLFPLLLFALRRAPRKQALAGIGVVLLTLLAWTVPMLSAAGGKAYVSALVSLWLFVPSKGTVFNAPVAISIARISTIVAIALLFFGSSAMLLFRRIRLDSRPDRTKRIFTVVWIAPGLLFFSFVFLKFVNSGYLLILAPPVCAWAGLWAANWYENSPLRRTGKMCVIAIAAALNVAIFVGAPLYCSYGEVRRFETELAAILRLLPRIADPRDTVIIGFDSHFLGYRHAGYYLPEYLTLQYPEVPLSSGIRVFAMRHRDTWLAGKLPLESMKSFILFPLPSGEQDYSDYMAKVKKRFPPGELRTTVLEGHEFTLGPVADLGRLFPSTDRSAARPLP